MDDKILKDAAKSHSRLSPSTASIWLNSTASPYFWHLWPDIESESEFADEGTKAHWYGEQILRGHMKPDELPEAFTEVMQYVNLVKSLAEHNTLLIEVNTSMTKLFESPEPITGTSDAVIINKDMSLDIVDLKWGMGVKVSAVDNPQAKTYAAGVLQFLSDMGLVDLDTLDPSTRITLHISQPRFTGNEYSFHNLTYADLKKFIEFAKAKVKEIFSGEGKFAAGEFSRFDKANIFNPMLVEPAKEVAAIALEDYAAKFEILDEDSLVNLYNAKSNVNKFFTSLEKFIKDKIIESPSGEYKGLKLIKIPGDREIIDEQALINQFVEAGADASALKVSKMVGMKDLDKLAKQYNIHPADLKGIGRKETLKITSAEDFRDALFAPAEKGTTT